MWNLLIPVETLYIVDSGGCVSESERLIDIVEIGNKKLGDG